MSNIKISIVSPVYQSEQIVKELIMSIKKNLNIFNDDYEILLINDGSSDNSWREIAEECNKDIRVKGINLSRNFGQHKAISAGLTLAQGEWIIIIDCDLQDNPEEIINLYNKAIEGWDYVLAKRKMRKDNFFKIFSSSLFNFVFNYLSGQQFDKDVANFGIYSKKVIYEYNKMPEVSRSFPSLIKSLGFNYTSIEVKHQSRFSGKSTYSISKLISLSADIILSNTNKPLKITIKIGFLISTISIILACYNIYSHFTGKIKVPGFTTTVFSIWFVGGLILFVLGVLGLYVDKIFNQVKGRQLFIIDEKINI